MHLLKGLGMEKRGTKVWCVERKLTMEKLVRIALDASG
jgi:hypothetical protein